MTKYAEIKIPVFINSHEEIFIPEAENQHSLIYEEKNAKELIEELEMNKAYNRKTKKEEETTVAIYWIKTKVPIPPVPPKKTYIIGDIVPKGDSLVLDETTLETKELW